MTVRSKRMAVVVGMAKREEEQAAAVFGERQQQLAAEQERLRELEVYYGEYATKLEQQTSGLRAEDFQTARGFLQRLSDAQSQQRQHIEKIEAGVEVAKKAWHTMYLKKQNLDKLVDRYVKEEDDLAQKKEQKMIDEWVSQSLSRK